MFSVGLLYSTQEFLVFSREHRVDVSDARSSFHDFGLVRFSDVLDTAQKAGWVDVDVDGKLAVTDDGVKLLAGETSSDRLRFQIASLAARAQPPWLRLFCRGREEAFPYLPREVQQCLKEADLLYGEDRATVEWWDDLSNLVYSTQQTSNLIVGREGERRSLAFEHRRTGAAATWTSLYSNNAGYDLLSYVNESATERLCIEVKASRQSFDEAVLYITQNEWATARETKHYQFHLWLLTEWSSPTVLSVPEVAKHIPRDNGEGSWQSVAIPFSAVSISQAEA